MTARSPPGPCGGWLYAVGWLICHQRPERSFHLAGAQLPVCARCLGLYAGGAAGAIGLGDGRAVASVRLAGAFCRHRLGRHWSANGRDRDRRVAGVGDPSNAWRATLAVPLGVAGGLVAGALTTDHLK